MTPRKKFTVDELIEDAELSLLNCTTNHEEDKWTFLLTFLYSYHHIEIGEYRKALEDEIEWNTNLNTQHLDSDEDIEIE